MLELTIDFPNPEKVRVSFDGEESEQFSFISPLNIEDLQELQWYVEKYSHQYGDEVYDERARELEEEKFPEWGQKLFKAVFQANSNYSAYQIYLNFRNQLENGRIISINSDRPCILSLPWELLHEPKGAYLFNETPRITIRRTLKSARDGRPVFKIKSKDKIHLLFVICRPQEAGFLDPRVEAKAVFQALENKGIKQVEVEFLRPGSLNELKARLNNTSLPQIDILHFDGHGVFDSKGIFGEKGEIEYLPSREGMKGEATESHKNIGYLLFEDDKGYNELVSAEKLGQLLHSQPISLVILSACQSAMFNAETEETDEPQEEAMGSVAARLTRSGIPNVIAMSYSVLIDTTRQFFGEFYGNLAEGRAIGEALQNARQHLFFNPKRGERRRGQDFVPFSLQDWFLPTLYQGGKDGALLTPSESVTPPPPKVHNLPDLPEAGFFGRTRELWDIERWFISQTRRITITGFGGQGKTTLALELAYWFLKTGLFERVGFVSYAAFQGLDALQLAVITLSGAFGETFPDKESVRQNLPLQKTLLIFDNLEDVKGEALAELLSEVKIWSETGNTRVILTTRQPDFNHPDYPTTGSLKHRVLNLEGLKPYDAWDFYRSLWEFPPEAQYPLPSRQEVMELFARVQYHPLSIRILVPQLKTRRFKELSRALEQAILDTAHLPEKDRSLIASLNLSLQRLDPQQQALVKRLGVFQGGAMEPDLLAITEFSQEEWANLRQSLVTWSLIQPESIEGCSNPFLRFHPTLAPALWLQLSEEERTELSDHHAQRYCWLSCFLYQEDTKNPHFADATAWKELPNLLAAVEFALAHCENYTMVFVESINKFLRNFGLNRYYETLSQRASAIAEEIGSDDWYLGQSNLGMQLLNAGLYGEALAVFQNILGILGQTPNYRRCANLGNLGRCLNCLGQAEQALHPIRQAIQEAQTLKATDDDDIVKDILGSLHTDLGNALTNLGDYLKAKTSYKISLEIYKKIDDTRGKAIVLGELGTLALKQGDLAEAEEHHQEALRIFQSLGETQNEAIYSYQLGTVYKNAQQWEAAEEMYLHTLEIWERLGNLVNAAMIRNQLAMVAQYSGRPQEAEKWYEKAIREAKSAGDKLGEARGLNNFAHLLQVDPTRLSKAQQLAEDALAIKLTLDPSAAEIWTTYHILADIHEAQGQLDQSHHYRQLEQKTYADFPASQHYLQQQAILIQGVVVALTDGEIRGLLEAKLSQFPPERAKFVAAIRQILAGERNDAVLCADLNFQEALVVRAILERIGG